MIRGVGLSVLALAGPALVVAAMVGGVVGLLQGVFNVQEQAIGFLFKIVVLLALLALTAGWSFGYAAHWAHGVFTSL